MSGIDYFRNAKEIAEESRPPLEPVVPVWVLDDWADAPPAPANPPKPAPLWETWAGFPSPESGLVSTGRSIQGTNGIPRTSPVLGSSAVPSIN